MARGCGFRACHGHGKRIFGPLFLIDFTCQKACLPLTVHSPSILVFQNGLTIFMTLLKLTSQHDPSLAAPAPPIRTIRRPSLAGLAHILCTALPPTTKTAALQFVSRATDKPQPPLRQPFSPLANAQRKPEASAARQQQQRLVYVHVLYKYCCAIGLVNSIRQQPQLPQLKATQRCGLEAGPYPEAGVADVRHLAGH